MQKRVLAALAGFSLFFPTLAAAQVCKNPAFAKNNPCCWWLTDPITCQSADPAATATQWPAFKGADQLNKITDAYGPRWKDSDQHPDNWDFHAGVDIRARTSHPVFPAWAGTVAEIRAECFRDGGLSFPKCKGEIHWIVIKHETSETIFYTRYVHLDPYGDITRKTRPPDEASLYLPLRDLRVGDAVTPFHLIGWTGKTGRGYKPHLHFDAGVGGYTSDFFINPLRLNGLPYQHAGPPKIEFVDFAPSGADVHFWVSSRATPITDGNELELCKNQSGAVVRCNDQHQLNRIVINLLDDAGGVQDSLVVDYDRRLHADGPVNQGGTVRDGAEDGLVQATTIGGAGAPLLMAVLPYDAGSRKKWTSFDMSLPSSWRSVPNYKEKIEIVAFDTWSQADANARRCLGPVSVNCAVFRTKIERPTGGGGLQKAGAATAAAACDPQGDLCLVAPEANAEVEAHEETTVAVFAAPGVDSISVRADDAGILPQDADGRAPWIFRYVPTVEGSQNLTATASRNGVQITTAALPVEVMRSTVPPELWFVSLDGAAVSGDEQPAFSIDPVAHTLTAAARDVRKGDPFPPADNILGVRLEIRDAGEDLVLEKLQPDSVRYDEATKANFYSFNWTLSVPGLYSVAVTAEDLDHNTSTESFMVLIEGPAVQGIVWYDADGDGQHAPNLPLCQKAVPDSDCALVSQSVFLDIDGDGQRDPSNPAPLPPDPLASTLPPNGLYTLSARDVPPATYSLRLLGLPLNWAASHPAQGVHSVTLDGQTQLFPNVDFGIRCLRDCQQIIHPPNIPRLPINDDARIYRYTVSERDEPLVTDTGIFVDQQVCGVVGAAILNGAILTFDAPGPNHDLLSARLHAEGGTWRLRADFYDDVSFNASWNIDVLCLNAGVASLGGPQAGRLFFLSEHHLDTNPKNLGISHADYVCGLTGWQTSWGDLREEDGRNHAAFLFGQNGSWHARADFSTEGDHEAWNISVLCASRAVATETYPPPNGERVFLRNFAALDDTSGTGVRFDTGIPAADWGCGVAGWSIEDGDLREAPASGDVFQAYAYEDGPAGARTWRLRAEWLTETDHERWNVNVLCLAKGGDFNRKPTFSVGYKAGPVIAGEEWSAQAQAYDADNHAIALTVSGLPPSALYSFPTSGSPGQAQGQLRWRTKEADIGGPYNLVFAATDERGARVDITVPVEVVANRPPTIQGPGDRVGSLGNWLIFQVDAEDEGNRLITMQMSGAPSGASLDTTHCGVGICHAFFSWRIPDQLAQREYFVTFTASDGLLASSVRVRIVVVDPTAPAFVLHSPQPPGPYSPSFNGEVSTSVIYYEPLSMQVTWSLETSGAARAAFATADQCQTGSPSDQRSRVCTVRIWRDAAAGPQTARDFVRLRAVGRYGSNQQVEAHWDLVFQLTRFGFTSPVLGSQLIDAERGHRRCRSLGPGWRWLEFHEQRGWQAYGTWRTGAPAARGWVRIDDKDAECFGGRPTGMTWSASGDAVTVGRSACDGCDPYQGDTSCSEQRPLYCVASYAGLALAATQPVPGSAIASIDWADQFCRLTFGDGWRWLDFHQQGGWRVTGKWITAPPSSRGWVWIDDTTAECHSTGGREGMTWAATSQPEGASCEGCNPYAGDTSCSEARPLICAKDLWP